MLNIGLKITFGSGVRYEVAMRGSLIFSDKILCQKRQALQCGTPVFNNVSITLDT